MHKNKVHNNFLLVIILFVIILSLFFFNRGNDTPGPISIKLITSVHKDLPFEFKTKKKRLKIFPGEITTINYFVKNLGEKKMTGIASFQVYPKELRDFMTKMNCFCYEEQMLNAGEEEKYALVLLIDPKVTKNIKEAIIQFVFFKK